MQLCRFTAMEMGSSIIHSPLLWDPNHPGLGLPSITSSGTRNPGKIWEKLGSSGKGVAKQAGEGNETCFSWELCHRQCLKTAFSLQDFEESEGEHVEKLPN